MIELMLTRTRTPEKMDDPSLDESLHVDALMGLGRLNMASSAHRHISRCLNECQKRLAGKPIRILDIATGGADIPLAIASSFRSSGSLIEIDACDISDTALKFASDRARKQSLPIRFFRLDALNDPLPKGYDLVTTSLFIHHLDPPNVVRLLSKMRASATQAVLIDDLERSFLNLVLVTVAARLLARSPIVHHDGMASVRAAYTLEEMQSLAREAGLRTARIQRHFPCRLFLEDWIT